MVRLGPTEDELLAQSRRYLEREGYVVVKAKSYRAAQERQRIAGLLKLDAEKRIVSAEAWAHAAHDELNRLRERLTFVYGVARSLGATDEQLSPHRPITIALSQIKTICARSGTNVDAISDILAVIDDAEQSAG